MRRGRVGERETWMVWAQDEGERETWIGWAQDEGGGETWIKYHLQLYERVHM